jgi:hypothetical protein
VVLCALGVACLETDDVHVGLRTTRFSCGGAPVAQNAAALVCGAGDDIDVLEIRFAVGGPTGSSNIKGFHFDVVYPREHFSYVDGSLSIVENNFLTRGGGVCTANRCTAPPEKVGVCDTATGLCTAPTELAGSLCVVSADCNLACSSNATCSVPGVNTPVLSAAETVFPDPMDPQKMMGRLTIAIDRANPADGVGAMTGGTREVLRFRLRAVSLALGGVDPTLLHFQNASAVDPADAPIGSVVFTDQLYVWVE